MSALAAFLIGLLSGVLLLVLVFLVVADYSVKQLGYQNIRDYFNNIDD